MSVRRSGQRRTLLAVTRGPCWQEARRDGLAELGRLRGPTGSGWVNEVRKPGLRDSWARIHEVKSCVVWPSVAVVRLQESSAGGTAKLHCESGRQSRQEAAS